MSAAGVLLGLLPSILTLVAPSIVENGLLSMRRPGLGFLLALGSPMVSPIRVFDLQDPQDVLRAVNTDSGQILQVGSMRALAISLLEYMLAMGSLVNCVALAYEIGIKTICSFASAVIYLPLLWTMTPFVIHALAIWSIRLRVRLVAQPVEVEIEGPSWAFLSHEARLSMVQPPFRLEGKPKTFLSNSVFWFTTICTLTHIIFGTLVFSSIIFVSVQDAVTRIWIRYLVSALVCRAIFVFEFSGMRKVSI